MTTADAPTASTPVVPEEERSPSSWLGKTDEWMSTASEWLNPILVKEARQALKSKQFVITFFVMLACGWLWSLYEIVQATPDVYYMINGPTLLLGYFVILGFPIIVVVPFTAFRSLGSELEDGTLELVAISSLGARQIVTGKLATAVLQTLVYFSGLAPFIAFTYFLNGVGIATIAIMLVSAFVYGVLLSAFCTMLATITRSRTWQTLLTVVVVVALIGQFIGYWFTCFGMIQFGGLERAVSEEAFSWVISMIFTQVAAFVLLFIVAATARLQFPSENRSTPLRWVMLFQTALYVYWAGFTLIALSQDWADGFSRSDFFIFVLIFLSIAGYYWAVMGSLIQGEHPEISLRTARSLPSHPISQALLTWLGPGPGKGYVFATTVMLTLAIFGLAAIYLTEWSSFVGYSGWYSIEEATCYVILLWSYFAAYLLLLRFVMMGLRKVANVGVIISLLLAILIFFGIQAVSTAAFFALGGYDPGDSANYNPLLLPNVLITLMMSLNAYAGDVHFLDFPYLMVLVPMAGVCSYFIGLVSSAREVAQRHVVAPTRVVEDDTARRKEQYKPASPWDEDTELPPPPTAVDVMEILQSEQHQQGDSDPK